MLMFKNDILQKTFNHNRADNLECQYVNSTVNLNSHSNYENRHLIYNCSSFLAKTLKERYSLVKTNH